MRATKFILVIFILTAFFASCSNNNEKQEENEKEKTAEVKLSTDKANIVYFHFSRRCATCIAIEDVAKEVANASSSAIFYDFNLDEESGEKMGEELDVEDQTVLIIKGDKQIDLTEEAFLNARSNPEAFKSLIEEKLTSL